MILPEARNILLDAFHPTNGCYRHECYDGFPYYRYDEGFIDGLAWVSIAWGAALKANDQVLAEKCKKYCETLLSLGEDARNYGTEDLPEEIKEKWAVSDKVIGSWHLHKAQSFAGPAGLEFAKQCGANIHSPFNVGGMASLLTLLGPLFGYLVKPISYFRQHMNSVWLAFLIKKKKIPSSMLWMTEYNPFYSYIAGKKCSALYPLGRRYNEEEELEKDTIVPLLSRKPSAWIFKSWPYTEYRGSMGFRAKQYVPIWYVVGEYLQQSLG